ncbi:MAG: hypothetical protein ACLQO7_02245 [Candidatus Bathyarchaeia archaeon]
MPLDQNVTFPAVLEKGNRVQIPKTIVWQFKMEQNQMLRISVETEKTMLPRYFYARMDKQGRILIPKLTLTLMTREEKPNIAGEILEVTVQPA